MEKQQTDLEQLEQLRSKTAGMTKRLQDLLQPYGLDFQPDHIEQTLEKMSDQLQQFRSESKSFREQQEEWRLDQQRLEQWRLQEDQLAADMAAQAERLRKEESELAALRAQRYELLEDRDPWEEREEINRAIERKKKFVANPKQHTHEET